MQIRSLRMNPARRGLWSTRPGDLIALMKPRVMSLAVFTAVVGMAMAPGTISPLSAAAAICAIAIGAGAAGVLNMWYDAGIDAAMARTSRRPIPAGRVSPRLALGFGLGLTGLSIALLATAANAVAAALLAFTIFFYAVIYTIWLKRRTQQNIVIGGIAGALPPVIGWAAAAGSVGYMPMLLFAIIALWTPPHFWSLALIRMRDYAAAGIPMMPVVAGETATKRQILIYALLLAPAAVLPWATGTASLAYGAVAVVLGAVFVFRAWQLLRSAAGAASNAAARRLFRYSILYLFLNFTVLLIDTIAARILAALIGADPA